MRVTAPHSFPPLLIPCLLQDTGSSNQTPPPFFPFSLLSPSVLPPPSPLLLSRAPFFEHPLLSSPARFFAVLRAKAAVHFSRLARRPVRRLLAEADRWWRAPVAPRPSDSRRTPMLPRLQPAGIHPARDGRWQVRSGTTHRTQPDRSRRRRPGARPRGATGAPTLPTSSIPRDCPGGRAPWPRGGVDPRPDVLVRTGRRQRATLVARRAAGDPPAAATYPPREPTPRLACFLCARSRRPRRRRARRRRRPRGRRPRRRSLPATDAG